MRYIYLMLIPTLMLSGCSVTVWEENPPPNFDSSTPGRTWNLLPVFGISPEVLTIMPVLYQLIIISTSRQVMLEKN